MYKNLEAEMKRRDINRKDLAKTLNVRYATVSDKMNGKYSFSLNEAMKIKNEYFTDQSIEYLFDTEIAQLSNTN